MDIWLQNPMAALFLRIIPQIIMPTDMFFKWHSSLVQDLRRCSTKIFLWSPSDEQFTQTVYTMCQCNL